MPEELAFGVVSTVGGGEVVELALLREGKGIRLRAGGLLAIR